MFGKNVSSHLRWLGKNIATGATKAIEGARHLGKNVRDVREGYRNAKNTLLNIDPTGIAGDLVQMAEQSAPGRAIDLVSRRAGRASSMLEDVANRADQQMGPSLRRFEMA